MKDFEIKAIGEAIGAQVNAIGSGPMFRGARYEQDLRVAVKVAASMPHDGVLSKEELVAKAARIADLMGIETRERQPKPDGETSQ